MEDVVFEYGEGFMEQNEEALKKMAAQMSPAAVALGKAMAQELLEEDDDDHGGCYE
jgi:hypothetical protein